MIVQWRRPLDALIRRRRGRARRARVRGYERQLVQLSPHRPVRERASRTSARVAPRTARAFSMHTRCLATETGAGCAPLAHAAQTRTVRARQRWHWRTAARARKGLPRCPSTRTKRHAERTSVRRASDGCRRALLGAVEHELGQPERVTDVRARRARRDGERAHARIVRRVRAELAGEVGRADRKGKRGARCFVCQSCSWATLTRTRAGREPSSRNRVS
jgi:hypothetical protein